MGGRWTGLEVEVNLAPRPPTPTRCVVTVSRVDPLDSRIRRHVHEPPRDWSHEPVQRPRFDRNIDTFQ